MSSLLALRRECVLGALVCISAFIASGCSGDPTTSVDPPTTNSLSAEDVIVYTAFDINTGRGSTYAVSADGAARLPLSSTSVDEVAPVLSSDGTRIVAVRLVDTLPQVFVMNADGSSSRLAAAVNGGGYWPSWTSAGDAIVFTNYAELKTWMMKADGAGPHRVVANNYDEQTPAISPDGRRIAFTSARQFSQSFAVFELFVMDIDGGNVQRLTVSPDWTYGYNVYPRWSPDGTRIAFIRSINDGVAHVFMINADGSDLHQVTLGNLNDFGVAWSPDGRRLAISRETMGGYGDIYLTDADDGTDLENITNTPGLDEGYPSWGKRGSR